MSQPEWMKKYQQIGQKGQEAVTSVGDEGTIEQTAEPSREIDPRAASTTTSSSEAPAPAASSSGAAEPIGISSVHSDEDAAALFFAAGDASASGAAAVATVDSTTETPSAAAEDTSTTTNQEPSADTSMIASAHSTDDAAVMFHAAGAAAEEEQGQEPPEEKEQEYAAAEEDIGESWVVKQDQIQQDNDGQEPGQEEEEVVEDGFMDNEYGYVDEDGNEVYYEQQQEEVEEDTESSEEEEVDDFDENQQQARAIVAASSQTRSSKVAPAPLDDGPKYDVEEQRRVIKGSAKERRSHMSPIVPIMSFLIIVAAVMLISFYVIVAERENRDLPTAAPSMQFPPLEPTNNGNVAAAATTPFDPFQNDCNFDNLEQPNFIDQCECGSRITIVADDVLARREDLVNDFMQSVFPGGDEQASSCSAENQALLWMSSGINNGGEIGNTLKLQRFSLALLYIRQRGTQWTRSTNWMSERDACAWEGVTCNSQSYVQLLNLDGNRLGGRVDDAPTLLNAIEGYSAAQNDMFGNLPRSFVRGGSLRSLDLSSNEISGSIPDPSDNSQLRMLNLESNRLAGEIPTRIGNFQNLESLNLAENRLTGTLPGQLFNVPLTELAVGGNSLEGTIPTQFGTATTLVELSLGPNLFEGEIPTFFDQLTNLKRLSMFAIPDLEGRLPASYGLALTKLEELTLSETSVSGNIPDQFSQMTDLQILNLSANSLARAIPNSLGQLTKLVTLELNDNAFTGTVPSSLGSLILLQDLQLHINRLVGTIPGEFAGLFSLRTLTFDGNFMNGRAPEGVCALREIQLEEFIVDCPSQSNQDTLQGIICSIPDCCTECL